MKNLILLIFQNIQRMTKLANQCNQLKKNLQKEKELGREIAEKSEEENSRLQQVHWLKRFLHHIGFLIIHLQISGR